MSYFFAALAVFFISGPLWIPQCETDLTRNCEVGYAFFSLASILAGMVFMYLAAISRREQS